MRSILADEWLRDKACEPVRVSDSARGAEKSGARLSLPGGCGGGDSPCDARSSRTPGRVAVRDSVAVLYGGSSHEVVGRAVARCARLRAVWPRWNG